MKFSNRVVTMQESPTRKLVPISDEVKKTGRKVYHLNIGQPDIKTPKEFYTAIKECEEGVLSYANSQGLPIMVESFVKYYNKHNIHFENSDIIVTNGGSEALMFAMLAVCDNGDEILIPEPFYTNYKGFGSMASVTVVPITTQIENGFRLPNKYDIEKLINNKTKAILITNPGNPTGTVYTKEEIYMIRDIAKEHNIYIIADEVYKEFIYGDLEFISFAQLEDISDRVILTDSISKRYSACGARIGCIASKNKEFMKNVMKLAQARLCVPTLEQVGAAALINVTDNYIQDATKEYKIRRDIVCNELNTIEGVIFNIPQGAFYVIAKLPVNNAEDFVVWLLRDFHINNETIILTPAEGFYITEGLGRNEVRISYCIKEDELKTAMNIFKEGLKSYIRK